MDREMLRLFYQRYSREIYLYLYSLCKSRETAEDMMQEVFLKALLSWNDENGNLRAWLYKVARNICMNHLKKAGRETAMEGKEIPHRDLPLADKFIKDEEKRMLYQGMLALPVRQREILELFYYSEMNIKEIAVLLSLSPENVRVLAFRAKKALKAYMEVNGYAL